MQNLKKYLATLFAGSPHGSRSDSQDLAVALHSTVGDDVELADYEIQFVGTATALVVTVEPVGASEYIQRRIDVQLRILTYINSCVAARRGTTT